MPTTTTNTPIGNYTQVSPTERVLPRRATVRHSSCVVVSDNYVKTLIEEQRAELGMSQDDLVRAADISLSTLQRVFKGHRPLPKHARALERVLHWPKGGLDEAFEGRRPTATAESEAEQRSREEQIRELKTMAAALREYANELEERLNALSQEGDEQQAV